MVMPIEGLQANVSRGSVPGLLIPDCMWAEEQRKIGPVGIVGAKGGGVGGHVSRRHVKEQGSFVILAVLTCGDLHSGYRSQFLS